MKIKRSVYVETSVVSYYANEISSDLKIAAEQRITREWWSKVLPQMDGFISSFVLGEIEKGKAAYVKARQEAITHFSLLHFNDDVKKLSDVYLKKLALPKGGDIDAFHLAIATVHGVDFLV